MDRTRFVFLVSAAATSIAVAGCAKAIEEDVRTTRSPNAADGGAQGSDDDAAADSDATADADTDADADAVADSGSEAESDTAAETEADAEASEAPLSDADAEPEAEADVGGPLGPPCTHATTGWIAWRFHYDLAHGATPVTDVYALPDKTHWSVTPDLPTSFIDVVHGGGLDLSGGNGLEITFSVAGLKTIRAATLTLVGRSHHASIDASFDASPYLYADVLSPTGSVKHTWPYGDTSVDYTGRIAVGDSPGSTGLTLLAGPASNALVVGAVELCIDGE